jgi:hypothetical protein
VRLSSHAPFGRIGITIRPDMNPLRPADGIVVREEAGEAFLLHLGTGRYFSLNRAGLVAWKALQADEDPLTALRSAFPSVSELQLQRDWSELSATLEREGLVTSAREATD